MKKYMLYGVTFAALSALIVAQPSYALFGLIGTDTADARQNAQGNAGQVLDAKRDELLQKRQEVQDRIAERRAAVEEKLSGKRAEACERKEATINDMLTQKVDIAQQYYDRFAAIQTKLSDYVAQHDLTVDSAPALELILTEKQQSAAALIETARITTFECTQTSAAAPGQVVRDLMDQKKTALVEYRNALKDYAEAVMQAAVAHEATPHRHGSSQGEESAQ